MIKIDSLRNFSDLAARVSKTCKSLNRTIIMLYVVLTAFVLTAAFVLGVEFGKTLCR